MSFGVRLATTLAVGCGFWCASHLYQRWRYAALEHEDKAMLQARPGDADRDKWIDAVKREAVNYGVSPSTLISLGSKGGIGAELSMLGDPEHTSATITLPWPQKSPLSTLTCLPHGWERSSRFPTQSCWRLLWHLVRRT